MSFPREMRERALVAAARHCCVCQRYKGVNVEVHHIVPKTEGGDDGIDNAIVLCFDCHADAGHYNPKHPKGTRFSSNELRKHRDTWYTTVKMHGIDVPRHIDNLYCRYLVCNSFEAFQEITNGNFSNIPISNPLLAPNIVYEFHRKIIAQYPSYTRSNELPGRLYPNKVQYMNTHPNARTWSKSESDYPYYETLRALTRVEIQNDVSKRDHISKLLSEHGVPPDQIAFASGYHEECGTTTGFQEIYCLRPVSSVYLAVTNVRDEFIRLSTIECSIENPAGLNYKNFRSPNNSASGKLKLPKAKIGPKSSIVIPVATILLEFPFKTLPEQSSNGKADVTTPNEACFEETELPDGSSQVVFFTDVSPDLSMVSMIGPAVWPSAIQLEFGESKAIQPVHNLDLSNLYKIERYWECGSCPFAFLADSSTSRITYIGDLFPKEGCENQKFDLTVPPGYDCFIIAELEHEHTRIQELLINDSVLCVNLDLFKGDTLSIPVSPGQKVLIIGSYVPLRENLAYRSNRLSKNRIITEYMSNFSRCCPQVGSLSQCRAVIDSGGRATEIS